MCVQLKKWTSVTPGWVINGMSVSVSNFVSAPTGKSTLSRWDFYPSAVDNDVNTARAIVRSPSNFKKRARRFLKSGPKAPAEPAAVDRSDAIKGANEEAGPSLRVGAEGDIAASDADVPKVPVLASGGERQRAAARVEGADPEVWAALPPDIQRELMLAEMGSLGSRTAQRAAANLKPGRRKPAPGRGVTKNGSIGKFFAKKT